VDSELLLSAFDSAALIGEAKVTSELVPADGLTTRLQVYFRLVMSIAEFSPAPDWCEAETWKMDRFMPTSDQPVGTSVIYPVIAIKSNMGLSGDTLNTDRMEDIL